MLGGQIDRQCIVKCAINQEFYMQTLMFDFWH